MTTTGLPSIAKIAELLGGEVRGNHVYAPGPGHSASDRSLSVLLDASAPDGFVVNSFAGDDAIACRDYVRDKLGLAPFEPKKKNGKGNGASPTSAEYVYRDARGEPYLLVKKYLDGKGKKQFWQMHWDGTQWLKGKPAGPKIPYRLPELLAAPTAVVYFVEGEKDADNLAIKACVVATSMSEGASAKWAPELTPYFKERRVVILPDADTVGRKHAQKVAKALYDVAASIKVVDLFPDRSNGHDISDWLKHDVVGAKLFAAVKAAPEWAPADEPVAGDEKEESEFTIEIARLAKLPVVKYEQERKAAAEALGFRTSILDQLVQAERAPLGGDDDGMQGRTISFPDPEPWPEPIDGAALLDEIAATLERYVVMGEQARHSTALWVAHTYLLDCFMISPRLAVRSPVKRCGKTTLLDVLACLVMKALPTANVSAAALFRVVESYRPTLLVDEADTFLAGADDLRGVLNSGHRRGGSVLRTVGDDHEPRAFATYAAVAVGIIGRLPDTLADRSISIDLKRKLASEVIESFRVDRLGHLEVLARKAARWAADNAVQIAAADPDMPPGVHSREADNWRPLLAIAEAAGGEWPNRASEAATQAAAASETDSQIELLLGDIRDTFAKRAANAVDPADRIPSGDLVEALVGIEGRPWAELGRSRKPLTQNRLARLLKPLLIAPDNIRIGDKVPKGYLLERFKDAFLRYLGPGGGAFEPLHRHNAGEMGTSAVFQTATVETDVAVRKCEKPANDGACGGVADQKGVSSKEWVSCAGNATEDPPDDPPADRTCAQCEGEIDGTERLVAVSGRAVWLHDVCERIWVRALDEATVR
jgi:5S rRNA maturation endonuclease (ribonuclease M5)